MLSKIPQINVYSFTTLDARASGLRFQTPYWAWSLPRMWYQKVPLMFFHRASILTKIPEPQDCIFQQILEPEVGPVSRCNAQWYVCGLKMDYNVIFNIFKLFVFIFSQQLLRMKNWGLAWRCWAASPGHGGKGVKEEMPQERPGILVG